MPFSYTPINDSVDLLLLGTMVAGETANTYYIYYSMEDDMWTGEKIIWIQKKSSKCVK